MSFFDSLGNFFGKLASEKMSNPKPNIVLQPTNDDKNYCYRLFFSKEKRNFYLITIFNATNTTKTEGTVFDFCLSNKYNKYLPSCYPLTTQQLMAIPSLWEYLNNNIPSEYSLHSVSSQVPGNLTKTIYSVFDFDYFGGFMWSTSIIISYKHSGNHTKTFSFQASINNLNYVERYSMKECADLIRERHQEERGRKSSS